MRLHVKTLRAANCMKIKERIWGVWMDVEGAWACFACEIMYWDLIVRNVHGIV